ncbi:MAG TPA: transposase [Alphaproteobacteria bacterium]|nr:transposase [Alphaproteobacteria bacterium]
MQGKVLPEERGAQPVYVGIDVCKTHLDVHLHPLGRRLKVANARDGIRRLKRLLADHAVALVAMEATARYHRAVQRSLYQAGFAVAVVNPLRARLFAEAAGALAKTDRVDAKMLAILAETLGPRATPPAPEALEALQELVHARSAALAERTALANRLAASHAALLRRELARRLKSLDGHIARLEAGIARRIAAEPGLARRHQILVSIPGVGPVVAATLLADLPELGAIDRRAVASLAGLAPFADDSGGAQGPRHIRGGRGHVRGALYWAALAAARHDQQLSAFYRRLRANAKKPKVALTAVMRKLVILANTLLKEDRLWTPTRP